MRLGTVNLESKAWLHKLKAQVLSLHNYTATDQRSEPKEKTLTVHKNLYVIVYTSIFALNFLH